MVSGKKKIKIKKVSVWYQVKKNKKNKKKERKKERPGPKTTRPRPRGQSRSASHGVLMIHKQYSWVLQNKTTNIARHNLGRIFFEQTCLCF